MKKHKITKTHTHTPSKLWTSALTPKERHKEEFAGLVFPGVFFCLCGRLEALFPLSIQFSIIISENQFEAKQVDTSTKY